MGDLTTSLPQPIVTRRPRLGFFDREAPFGYALVLPAVLYLLVFIAYPFFMSIYMSFTDAQAGNRKWTFIGPANYSKVKSYELSANDFVIASFPTVAEANTFIEKKAEGQQVTDPAPGGRTDRTEAGLHDRLPHRAIPAPLPGAARGQARLVDPGL